MSEKKQDSEGVSDGDSMQSLFRDHATPNTTDAKDGNAVNGTIPDNDTFVTQPTQILDTPPKIGSAGREYSSSPPVEVAASSPAPASPTAKPNGIAHQATNGANGFSHPMAPPGTEFRPPTQWRPTTQTQPQTQNFDSDDDRQSSNSGDDRMTHIKPSVFEKGSRTNGIGKVEESPNASFGSFIAQYSNASPSKRPAPEDSAGMYARSRPAKVQKSEKDDDMPQDIAWFAETRPLFKLADIEDNRSRAIVEDIKKVLDNTTYWQIYSALQLKQGNRDDTITLMFDTEQKLKDYEEAKAKKLSQNEPIVISDDELTTLPTAKQKVEKVAGIASRWGKGAASKQGSGPAGSQVQDNQSASARARIVRPGQKRARENDSGLADDGVSDDDEIRAPKRHQTASIKQTTSNGKLPSSPPYAGKPMPRSRSLKEVDSDSESEADQEVDRDVDLESRLLKEINEGTEANLRDLSTMNADIVAAVMTSRPYRTLAKVRDVTMEVATKSKKNPIKTTNVGDRLVDAGLEMLQGYDALDSLVNTCKEQGKPIVEQMQKWGLAVFGSDRNGELEMTKINAEDASNLLKKPSNMAEDLVLKDYQVAGLNWLVLLFKAGLSAILADDMGLGKTCQVISFLAHLKQAGLVEGVHLVIVPGSTLENWLREIERFCPNLRVEPYYGDIKERPAMQDAIFEELDNIDIVITTYDIATKKADTSFLRKLQPDVCVYDEAHALKNSTTGRYKQLMKIPADKMRLLLTGTPLQNNLVELGSLLGFLMPNVFREHELAIEHVFKQRGKASTREDTDSHDALLSDSKIARAREMLTPFILRRKKDQVLRDLPKKTSRLQHCELADNHSAVYEDIWSRYATETKTNTKGGKNSTLMDLRKAAIHPLLLRKQYDDKAIDKIAKVHAEQEMRKTKSDKSLLNKKIEQAKVHWLPLNDYQIHCEIRDTMPELKGMLLKGEPWLDSVKVQALLELLAKHAEEGHTSLIFSQFTTAMDILEPAFESQGIPFFRLDGSTNMNQRQQIIDEFTAAAQADDGNARPVFMLSTKAGGQGINLTAANRVIIFDSGFNPQDDVQAENRAHRVGQTRDVEVIRLVAKGTIEEAIVALGERKLRLDELVAGGGSSEAELERNGAAIVEGMMKEQLHLKQEDGKKDVGDTFMTGLKKAGLDMSAAAKGPLKR